MSLQSACRSRALRQLLLARLLCAGVGLGCGTDDRVPGLSADEPGSGGGVTVIPENGPGSGADSGKTPPTELPPSDLPECQTGGGGASGARLGDCVLAK
jgi:hypothetical protein